MATRLYKTVKPSGGDYTSLAACLAANQKNLVTADQYFDIEIDGVWENPDTAQVTIQSPWVTDADHYINIYTTPQARHSGVWDTNKYRHVIPAAYNQYNIGVDVGYVFIDGILAQNPGTGSAGSYCIVYNNNIPFGRVKNCLVHGSPSTGIWMGATNGEVINCIAYDCGARGILLRGTNSKAYNCTAAYCAYGIRNYFQDSGPGATIINCIARNNTYADFYHEGSYPPTVSYCASSDATADDWGGSGNRINQSFSMVDPTGSPRNLHLASDDGGARNFGTDLSAYFTDDIDGQTRPGESYWDIGADEYISGGETRDLIASISGSSATPAINAAIARALLANIGAQTVTPDISVTIARALMATIAPSSITPDIAINIARALTANIAAQSVIPDITITMQGQIYLVANIAAASIAPDIAPQILRALSSTIQIQTATADAVATVTRNLIANVAAATVTPDITITLENVINLVAAIAGVSLTPNISASIARSLSMLLSAETLTPDIEANVARSLVASIQGTSVTPDDLILILGGIGIILDPGIVSVTPIRIFESETPARAYSSTTPVRMIESI